MSTRLDSALQKYPDHADGIRLLADRDPSGKLKYLDWGVKILVSGQALAPEIADVLDLFHRFAGQRLETARRTRGTALRVHPDIHTYRPQDLAGLRDLLRKIQRETDRKRRKREKLYKIEGAVEADVVYEADDLVVRHIKNKQASVHYGHGTKWCTLMLRERYFEEYEAHNATFFFFERKVPQGDEYDKITLMLSRGGGGDYDERTRAFTTLDRQVDMLAIAEVHGPRVFEIFRLIFEASERYPGSTMFQVYSGAASEAQLAEVFAIEKIGYYETRAVIEAIACNDAAPWLLLEAVRTLSLAIGKRKRKGSSRFRRFRRRSEKILNSGLRLGSSATASGCSRPASTRGATSCMPPSRSCEWPC